MGLFDKFLKPIGDSTKITPQPVTGLTFGGYANNFIVHSDIADLIWVADGPRRNYVHSPAKSEFVNVRGFSVNISFMGQEEPSAIHISMPIAQVQNIYGIERPPYYPSYAILTTTQKAVYWNFLNNPYNPNINIGFVFIFYYGLERHLLCGNYDKAIDVIIKLRDIHKNNSFQSYSANAIILTSLIRNRPDILEKFINSLDKSYELNFSDNMLLLCKYLLNIPLKAHEIMRSAKAFGFTKLTYIRNYSELFENAMTMSMQQLFGTSSIYISSFISETEFLNAPAETYPIFANMSILGKTIQIPVLARIPNFSCAIYNLLDTVHEQVKVELAEMRKKGDSCSAPIKTGRPKSIPSFDAVKENELLIDYSRKKGFLDRHFSLIALQDFYYKYRDLSNKYLELCLKYCYEDIASLDNLQVAYKQEELNRINQIAYIYTKLELQKRISEITWFNGRIPAFERLVIIYDKHKDFKRAISICDAAINYYSRYGMADQANGFFDRKSKLITKASKEVTTPQTVFAEETSNDMPAFE